MQYIVLCKRSAVDARWRLKTVATILDSYFSKTELQLTRPIRRRNGWRWIAPTSSQRTKWPPNSLDLNSLHYHVECDTSNTSSISPTAVKAKDHPRAKKCIAADLGWLATDNDQQSYQQLSHMSECMFRPIWIRWLRVICHNFAKIADNWIKIGTLA